MITDSLERLESLKEIEYHLYIATNQRAIYNSNRIDKELLRNNILLEMDFKGTIKIGNKNTEIFNFVNIFLFF